jgi:integrase
MPKLRYLFWILRHRKDASGKAPLSCRIYVDSRRIEVSPGLSVPVKLWQPEAQRCKGESMDALLCNKALNELRIRIDELFTRMRNGEQVDIKPFLKGESTGIHSIGLLECMDRITESKKTEKLSHRTIQNHEAIRHNIGLYLATIKLKDIAIEKVNLRFMSELIAYQKSKLGHSHNYIAKAIEAIKQAVSYAHLHEYLLNNHLISYRFKKVQKDEHIFLTLEEIRRIAEHRFDRPRLQRVADVFVLQCYTGLAYAEYSRLTKANLTKGIDGSDFIIIERKKTKKYGSTCEVPLLDEAKAILAKYENNPDCLYKGKLLPVITNARANAYIKEAAAQAGIERAELITTHIGRKSAGSFLLNIGMPIEVVSRILGHKDIAITQRTYAFLLQTTSSKEMAKVQERLRKQG